MKTYMLRKTRLIQYLIGLIFCCVAFTACEPDPSIQVICKLEVTVRGTLSGKLRKNIQVSVYNSESDANNEINSVGNGYTDLYGVTEMDRFEPGKSYWVRADAVFSKSIKKTTDLLQGRNFFEMTLL
jgi:hypothetical protein